MPTADTLCEPEPLMRRLGERLGSERADVPLSVLDECVRDAWSSFEHARVQLFVPVLVERAVRARIGWLAGAGEVSLTEVSLRTWAWLTARNLLAGELPRRWAHTWGVARRAQQIAPAFPAGDREVLVASAWLHDIGYAAEVTVTGMHQVDGARYLVGRGVPFRVAALVAHHAGAAAVAEFTGLAEALAVYDDEQGPVRDALWYCDMTTSPDGRPVTFRERMAELRRRRSADDPVVRALAVNEVERAAAVHRTEERLRHAGLVPAG
ncbi:three-helix bundle dimerization domain-containing protein [Actinophytocola glycyrrhizae]|uniref:Three-helix bundle dimerization domain-containing protein n=1 Tax=Actinophytocola glycyrrhizae TaxID=2044873 RepID=A0ABV9SCU6_9PSEU